MNGMATLSSLPPEIAIQIVLQLVTEARTHPPPTLQTGLLDIPSAVWPTTSSYLTRNSRSSITCLSETSRCWRDLCRPLIWKRIVLSGSMFGLLQFIEHYLPLYGLGGFIKAIHVSCFVHVSQSLQGMPISRRAFGRRLSALDGFPVEQLPPYDMHLAGDLYEPCHSSFLRLVSTLADPLHTPNLEELSFYIPGIPCVSNPLLPFSLLRTQTVDHLRHLSILVHLLNHATLDEEDLAQYLRRFHALEEIRIAGQSGWDPTLPVVQAIASLPKLKVLRLANHFLIKPAIEDIVFKSTGLTEVAFMVQEYYYNEQGGQILINWLSQWKDSLESLTIICQYRDTSPFLPMRWSESDFPTFTKLSFLKIGFGKNDRPPNVQLTPLLQQRLPFHAPFLQDLQLILPVEFDHPSTITLPAIPLRRLCVGRSRYPTKKEKEIWRSANTGGLEVERLRSWTAADAPVKGHYISQRRQKLEPSPKGVLGRMRNLVSLF